MAGEAAGAERLGHGRLDEQDVRLRRHRADVLDVERRLNRPAEHRRPRRRVVRRHGAGRLDDPEARRRRQVERLVERLELAADVLVAERVDDRDRLALAVQALAVERPEIVRAVVLERRVAGELQLRLALGRRRRRRERQ
jgi:hypothetical protein